MVRCDITFKRKHISLGSFPSVEMSKQAREEAATALGRRGKLADRALPPGSIMTNAATHLPGIADYDLCHVLPFEKWVCLINFRDNGIYSRNPIYLKKDYFEYWLDPALCLKFSRDDLFYYSEHKICKRGGHLFVSEFGMQTSLLSRYGIHSFSVAGRDYEFANNDSTDLRYSNIRIINRYRGVFRERIKGSDIFTAKIHINGTVIVGRYKTEEEAAVAYNKAADVLAEAGFMKNYEKNYIDGLTDEEYRTLYDSVSINDVTAFLS